jgi:hypothetical protein
MSNQLVNTLNNSILFLDPKPLTTAILKGT